MLLLIQSAKTTTRRGITFVAGFLGIRRFGVFAHAFAAAAPRLRVSKIASPPGRTFPSPFKGGEIVRRQTVGGTSDRAEGHDDAPG